MSSSFRKIDYRLRPAKAVERRMMAETFLRLREFRSVETYQYVGMGSVYFSDFSLFHSLCGFSNMVSIEGTDDLVQQERFKLNVPHAEIRMEFGHSNTVIPRIDWTVPSITWLDYDGVFDGSVCRDVAYIVSKAQPVSLFGVSVNCRLEDDEDNTKSAAEVLRARLGGEAALPAEYEAAAGKPIHGKDVPAIFREILTGIVLNELNNRNAGKAKGTQIQCKQVLFFSYNDGAPMLTLFWALHDDGQGPGFAKCAFDQLHFFRDGAEPFKIKLPLITNVEARLLNRMKPGERLPLPPSELSKYAELKRYWPTFANVELL